MNAATSVPRARSRLVPVALWAAAATLLVLGGCAASRLRDAAALVRASKPLQRPRPDARRRLLVVGDSTAVGTGASSSAASLVGLLARELPELHIENRGRIGATFASTAEQLEQRTRRFDVVLVLAGANDVIRLHDLGAVARDVDRVLQRACEIADMVIVMPPGNLGNSPFFFAPLSWLMASRSRRLHDAVCAVAQRRGAIYVRLHRARKDDPFAVRRELHARDALHPSDEGYRIWFDELDAQAGVVRMLGRPTGAAMRAVVAPLPGFVVQARPRDVAPRAAGAS